jgi:hypothetical protein
VVTARRRGPVNDAHRSPRRALDLLAETVGSDRRAGVGLGGLAQVAAEPLATGPKLSSLLGGRAGPAA